MTWSSSRPFQSLALTGGGYRGLFTARALQVMEEHAGKPIGRFFDLTCGTSIGGVVALAIAFEIPMSDVVRVFLERGEHIFPPRKRPSSKLRGIRHLRTYARKPRYAIGPLRAAIEQIIDKDATLGDAVHPVAIPAVNLTQGQPQIFKTRHKAEWHRDSQYKAIDVALATAAAPTFFELAELGGSLYADGGLFANAPDLIAIHEAEHFFGVSTDNQRLLSIGTTTKSYSVSYASGRQFGLVDWMVEDQRLFSVTISSQQQFVHQLVSHRLGDRYFRLDGNPSQEQSRDLGLDKASEAAQRTLLGMASKATSDVLNTQLATYLRHEPQLKIVRDG